MKTARVCLRIDADLKRRAQRLAEKRDVSLTHVLEELLRAWLRSDTEVEQA